MTEEMEIMLHTPMTINDKILLINNVNSTFQVI